MTRNHGNHKTMDVAAFGLRFNTERPAPRASEEEREAARLVRQRILAGEPTKDPYVWHKIEDLI